MRSARISFPANSTTCGCRPNLPTAPPPHQGRWSVNPMTLVRRFKHPRPDSKRRPEKPDNASQPRTGSDPTLERLSWACRRRSMNTSAPLRRSKATGYRGGIPTGVFKIEQQSLPTGNGRRSGSRRRSPVTSPSFGKSLVESCDSSVRPESTCYLCGRNQVNNSRANECTAKDLRFSVWRPTGRTDVAKGKFRRSRRDLPASRRSPSPACRQNIPIMRKILLCAIK